MATSRALDLTNERAAEIRSLRNKGRKIAHMMSAVEANVEATKLKVADSLSPGRTDDELASQAEYGAVLWSNYDGTFHRVFGYPTREWVRAVDQWCERNGVGASLPDLPTLRIPGWNGKDSERGWELKTRGGRKKIYRLEKWREALLAFQAAVETRVYLLEDQLLLLGRGSASASTNSILRTWDLIRETSVFTPEMLRGLLNTIEKRSSKKEIADSIAASKELVEGLMRGILLDRGFTPRQIKPMKVATLFDECQGALASTGDRVVTDPAYAAGRIFGGAKEMLLGLAELRNAAGGGHGRASYAAGLTSSHAAFVGDAAYAICGFLAEQHLRIPR